MKKTTVPHVRQLSRGQRIGIDFKRNKAVYLMALICLSYYFVFKYGPMFGVVVAFKDFRIARGIWASKWVGFKWFEQFFNSFYVGRLIRNTLVLNLMSLAIGYTTPVLFALLINEVHNKTFKRVTQSISYMPNFISEVVVCGMVLNFISADGLFNQIRTLFGQEAIMFGNKAGYFRWIYVLSGVWQNVGYSSIVYLSAITGISNELMDAAAIDGCNRFQRIYHVTIPAILPTIILIFLMKLGSMMSLGYSKVILLYNDAVMETADVISSFVYRQGMLNGNYSYTAAIDLFNNVVNIVLLFIFNAISRKVSDISLW